MVHVGISVVFYGCKTIFFRNLLRFGHLCIIYIVSIKISERNVHIHFENKLKIMYWLFTQSCDKIYYAIKHSLKNILDIFTEILDIHSCLIQFYLQTIKSTCIIKA